MPIPSLSRVVDAAAHLQFADLSGDHNPMHMDPVVARRTQAGEPVVHGVHSLLWSLESLVAAGVVDASITRIRARFLKWVYLGDKSDLLLADDSLNPTSFTVEVSGMPVLSVDISYGERASRFSDAPLVPSPTKPLASALDLFMEALEGRKGEAYTAPAASVQALFPGLTHLLGAATVSEIASCSYIVGMEAPGLHSMFSKFDVTLIQPPEPDAHHALHYDVSYLDPRFRKARISVAGSSIEGNLDVFIRLPPVNQASMTAISETVDRHEFEGMNALVIGGSRGLGEVTAKIIASGGGTPTITYALGKKEAEAVVQEIAAHGGSASTLQYDVRNAPAPQLTAAGESYTHIFYFATATIFKPKAQLIAPGSLAGFVTFYLQGFYDLCTELLSKSESPGPRLVAYYPSTVFVEERPAGMTEYAMIKAAGEQMCRDMNQYMPGLHVIQTRLPRLPTDQTAGVLPSRDLNPVEVMLTIVREAKKASA